MTDHVPSFLLSPEPRQVPAPGRKSRSLPFIDRTLHNVARFIRTGYVQNDVIIKKGFFQRLDARVKILFLVWFVVLSGIIRHIPAQLALSGCLFLLFLLSRVNLWDVYKKIFLFSFWFGFVVVSPAALNLVTGGEIWLNLFHLDAPRQFLIYHIPADIGITREGIEVVLRLYFKVVNSLSVTLLVLYTTVFADIIKSLKLFRVPDIFLLIITLTHRFVFILSRTVEETYFALKLRWWQRLRKSESGKIVAGRVGYLFRKSWLRYEEIYRAMIARGYSGHVHIYFTRRLSGFDIISLFGLLIVGGLLLVI
ncbi:MAG: cobalt ECF transporter T component CbiQ [Bacteroidota bacterium]|nr:cobalt ECF transporter T component CbiQ [Bacteroidota bacterium]